MLNKTFSEIGLWDNVEKFGRARQDTDENTTRRMLDNQVYRHTARIWNNYIIAFPRQQWLRERALMLRNKYEYTAFLVHIRMLTDGPIVLIGIRASCRGHIWNQQKTNREWNDILKPRGSWIHFLSYISLLPGNSPDIHRIGGP